MLQAQNQQDTPSTTDNADVNKRRIRELNDAFRKNPFCGPRRFMITQGVASLPDDDRLAVIERMIGFSDFSAESDPHGEHDFGAFDFKGSKIFWKIDYYAHDMERGSPDPSDPDVTRRVLTLMLADEY